MRKPNAKGAELVAAEIERVIRDTALECSEICRRHADRAPGGLVPVGAAARASDEIRQAFGLGTQPVEPLAEPRRLCLLAIRQSADEEETSPALADRGFAGIPEKDQPR